MKQLFLILIALSSSPLLMAQTSKFELRAGIGSSFLGTGDMRTITLENELYYALNDYFTFGGGIAVAHSNRGVFEQASFLQANSNLFISPFRNNRRLDWRLGTGISWYGISDVRPISFKHENGSLVHAEYQLDRRNAPGINAITEVSYLMNDRFFAGVKLFSQFYSNADRNTGAMLRVGLKL
jgi:long-subunit fatty acid transport protein